MLIIFGEVGKHIFKNKLKNYQCERLQNGGTTVYLPRQNEVCGRELEFCETSISTEKNEIDRILFEILSTKEI